LKKFREKLSLFFRKKALSSGIQTILLICILVGAFIAINLFVDTLDIDDIDVTANKIYTLSDESKKAIENVKEDAKIYLFGFDEDSTVTSLVKQYVDTNDHISYEILTEESNAGKVQEFGLSGQDGYSIVVIETSSTYKLIDASSEFYSYDYTTGQEVDLTEQTITNSILNITSEEKPIVYFLTGHDEYTTSEMGTINTYLANEAYTVSSLNLISKGSVPEDCNLLVILNPTSDFAESERDAIINYINEGGNILFTTDISLNGVSSLPNVKAVLDLYGVEVDNAGYVFEQDSTKMASGAPYILMPDVSSSNNITADIYTDGYLVIPYAGRILYKSDEELENLNVTTDDLITSSSSSLFISDLYSNVYEASSSAESGSSVIASELTKVVKEAENDGDEIVTSQLIVIANTVFASDYTVEGISTTYPVSYFGNNKDMFLDSISGLTKTEDGLKIRKDMSTSTFAPSDQEYIVVLVTVFAVPIVIILLGIIMGIYRKRKR
jgi:hypothetical protein